MVATVASIDVTLRLLGADSFQAQMRNSGSVSEQTGARVQRAMDGISTSTERVSRAAEGLNRSSNAINAIGISALRAETSVLALNKAFTLVGTAVGGLAGGVAANAFKNYADTATSIANRLATVIPIQNQRAAIDQQIFDTAQRTRTSYEATANIFSRLSLSSSQLGASQSDILKVVETTQKALQAGGATAAESASIATQLSQAIGSGRLQGDELRSIAENSPVLIQAIAKEFDTTVGGLKALGTAGELESGRVFKAILKAGEEVDRVFSQTTPTIAAGIQQIDNALTRYIGGVDKSIGATKALSGGLQYIAQNLNAIGDAAVIAVAALAGPIGSRVLTGASTRVSAPFRDASATAAAGLSGATASATAATAARQAAQVGLRETEAALKSFESQPRFRQAAPDLQASYTQQAAQVDRLREASARTADKEAAALLKRGEAENVAAQISQTAANRVQSAKDTLAKREAALNDLIAKRPALEQQAASAGVNTSRKQQGGYYDALYKVVEQRDKLADTNATIALTKRNIEALDEAISRAQSNKTSGDFIPQAMAKRQAEVARLPMLTAQRDDQGRVLNDRERALVDAEKRIGDAQASEREKAGKRLADLDNQISRSRAGVSAQNDKIADAERVANESLIASAEKRARIQAELDAKAVAATAQRRAAQQALAEADARLGGLSGQVGASAASGRAAAIKQISDAQSVLNRAYFAEQEALGNVAQATAKTSATKVALAGAARLAGGALSGLVGLLGGPLGAALTAAGVAYAGYELYNARAAAQVQEHKEAVDRLIESTKRLNALSDQGRVRTVQQQVEDAANAAGAQAASVDSRNALITAFTRAQGRAKPGASGQTRSEYSSAIGADVTTAYTTLDDALGKAGLTADKLMASLRKGGDDVVTTAKQAAEAIGSIAKDQPDIQELSLQFFKFADELERASKASQNFNQAANGIPQLVNSPLDLEQIVAPKFKPAPVIEAFKASIKEVKDDLLSLGDVDIDIRGLNTSREQIAQFATDIVEARANAMGAISGQTVLPEINEAVQAFGNGKTSAEDYAQALIAIGQKFPSFQPLIDSLIESAQKALAASADMSALGNQVKGLDGLVANILVKIGVSGKLPDIGALAATEQAKADAALNKVEQSNRVLALRADGKKVEADVLAAQQSNPALDVDRARKLYTEQNRLNDQISASKKSPKKSQDQKDAESLAKKLEELDQDTKVASLNDFDQKTVRFAQSAKVASEQIQAFITAARAGDMSTIPPTMQEIYDKMRQLEGVKLGKQALDDLFPGRLVEQQIESVRRAAANAPEIAANLDKIEMSIRAKNAPQWVQDFSSGFTDMAKSIANGTATAADAMQTFKTKIINIALDVAFKPIETAIKSLLGSFTSGGSGGIFGFFTSLFAADGLVPQHVPAIPGYASGRASVKSSGLIVGPGSSVSDSILALADGGRPIRVSNREAIIKGKSVEKYGERFIKSINDGTLPRIPGFAIGGLIDEHMSRQEGALRSAPSAMAAMGGMGMKVVVNEAPGGDKAQVRRGHDERGNPMLIVDMLDRGIASKGRRSAVARAASEPLRG